MEWKFPDSLRQNLLKTARREAKKDPELKGAPFTPEEFTEAFVRMAECQEWPGSKATNPKQVVQEFKEHCERTLLRELKKIVAARGRRN